MVKIYLARIPKSQGERESSARAGSAAVRSLLLLALKKEYPGTARSFRLEKDGRGRPFLAGWEELHISLSQSGEFVACALADRPVGVDVEQWRKGKSPERVMRRLHIKEREILRSCSEKEREQAFYGLWVRKESFLKAMGEGLRLPLDSFCTAGEAGIVKVEQTLKEAAYYVREYELEGRAYSLAACSEETDFAEEPLWLEL